MNARRNSCSSRSPRRSKLPPAVLRETSLPALRHQVGAHPVAVAEGIQLWEATNGRGRGKITTYVFPALTLVPATCQLTNQQQKEVERRRRGNINEGINELGRIVPSGNGEKAKGAILARSVQYIHHLKENEARNIEKWTLEKLLMDQAMGDLQNQLEEVKRMWEEERNARQRLEMEVESLRNSAANGVASALPPPAASGTNVKSSDSGAIDPATGNKRKSEEVGEQTNGTATANGDGDRDGKRQRTD